MKRFLRRMCALVGTSLIALSLSGGVLAASGTPGMNMPEATAPAGNADPGAMTMCGAGGGMGMMGGMMNMGGQM